MTLTPPRRALPSRHYESGAIVAEKYELERLLGRRAVKQYLPLQRGDVRATYASIDRLAAATGFAPTTALADGLARFVAWYREYYGR